jgi:hypothetical protein
VRASSHVDRADPVRPASAGDPAGATVSAPGPAAGPAGPAGVPDQRVRGRWLDAGVALAFAALALALTARAWVHWDDRLLGDHPLDQSFNEWMLARAADAVTHLDNPLFSHLQNAPDGVNLVTNVGLLLPAYVLVPVTLAAGPAVSYLVLMTANLAGTAFAWYWVLSRHLVRSRAAAVVGGLFCGFAPAMVSESTGHPHITAQWLVPFLVWQVVRLATPGPAVRRGLVLGGLVALQFFLGLEILLLTAIAGAIAAVGYAAMRPRAAGQALPSALHSLAVSAAVVLPVTAYPIWFMFAGPQSRVGHPPTAPNQLALALEAFVAFPSRSLAGGPGSSAGLAPNTAEETAFFGWPLLLLVALAACWLVRRVEIRVLALTAAVGGVFAMGTTWAWDGRSTVPAPFGLVDDIPPFDAVVPARFALITTAAVGVLLALATDRVLAGTRQRPALRGLAGLTLVAALVPIVPAGPLGTTTRPPVPRFVTSGDWRQFVAEGRTLVPVPLDSPHAIRWGPAADFGFTVPQGYFIGPTSATDRHGRWGARLRPTSVTLDRILKGRHDGTATATERQRAVADVRFWQADAVVLERNPHEQALRQWLDGCFGPGRQVDDVWVWDVRSLTN